MRHLIWQKTLETGGHRPQANCRLPQPLPALGTHYLWMVRGIPFPSQPSFGRLLGAGPRRPWRPLCNPKAREAALMVLQRRLQGFLPPGVFSLARPWRALNPRPGAGWWLRLLWEVQGP